VYRLKLVRRIAAALAAALMLAGCNPQPPAEIAGKVTAPDLVFTNGKIYTMNGARSWAQAVAITDGRFSYVGTDDRAKALAGPDTTVVDLGGRMVLPGLFDDHIHPVSSGMELLSCDLSLDSIIEEFGKQPDDLVGVYQKRIKHCADEHPDAAWITGSGWVMSAFGPGAKASRKLLDEVVPDRPVYVSSTDGHSAWVNSKALEIAGVTADTPDPKAGIIDREPGGKEPLGSLQEAAMALVEDKIPPPDLETRLAGLQYAVDMLNGYGITSIQAANESEPYLEAYRALDDRGKLTLRVVAAQDWDEERGPEQLEQYKADREKYSGGNLQATTVKIFADGVMENFTAAMLEPYIGQGGTRGTLNMTPEMLKADVIALDAAGFQVHIHAIGDRAVRVSLDAFQAAREANGVTDNRHHIAHLEVIQPSDIPRFRELGVSANFQPLWAYADDYITDLTLPFIKPELARWIYPIASVYDSGAVVVQGSDWSVSTANPFWQIETAITRKNAQDADSTVFIPEERITLPEALAMVTINAAWIDHRENDTGSIELGKLADLAVLDRNLFEIAPEDISETQTMLTLFGGQVVHGSLAAF
jgi:predicted amidohydrolase YtcJ